MIPIYDSFTPEMQTFGVLFLFLIFSGEKRNASVEIWALGNSDFYSDDVSNSFKPNK